MVGDFINLRKMKIVVGKICKWEFLFNVFGRKLFWIIKFYVLFYIIFVVYVLFFWS